MQVKVLPSSMRKEPQGSIFETKLNEGGEE